MTKDVSQLSELSKTAEWNSLTELPHAVTNPMMATDDQYLYVLGGYDCRKCVRMSKDDPGKWDDLPDLPPVDGATKCNQYWAGFYCGALIYRNTLTVLTRTQYMTLDANNNNWDIELYKDGVNNITRFTPAIYRGMIVASIERDSVQAKVERYSFKKKKWVLFNTIPDGIGNGVGIGGGRFLAMTYLVREHE